jgi:tetratricopeptide (TPR) repeat protein
LKKSKKVNLLAALCVAIVTFIVYLPALKNGFVSLDDEMYITNNPYITRLNSDFFGWAFSEFYAKNWHPLTWLSHAIDYSIFGLNPFGHHLTNVIIHSTNSMLVVLLSIRLLIYYRAINEFKQLQSTLFKDYTIVVAGTISGLLFGIHPIHVESAAWVAERKDVLCAFFFLLSLLLYLQYAYSRAKGGAVANKLCLADRNYILSLIFFIFAVFSKPMAVTLPVVLLLLDWLPFERFHRQSFKKIIIEKTPFFIISFDLAVNTILAQRADGIKTLSEFPFSWRIINSFHSIIAYIVRFIYPVGLSPFYPFPDEKSLFSLEYTLMIFIVSAITIIFAALFLRGRKVLFVVWIYYLITLLPVLDIVKVGQHAFADRYMYLPSVGFCLLVGIAASILFNGKIIVNNVMTGILRSVYMAWVGAVLIALSIVAQAQIVVWKDSITMWNRVVEVTEATHQTSKYSYFGYFGRGSVFASQKKYEEAVNDLERAVERNPSIPDSYFILGNAYLEQKRYEKAIETYLKGLQIYPYHILIRNFLSLAYIDNENFEDAYKELSIAFKLSPSLFFTYHNMGIYYEKQGKISDACKSYQRALDLNRNYIPTKEKLKNVCVSVQ